MAKRLKVLLSAHACAPGMGSEPGFGWNWSVGLSRYCDVWVLTHPAGREAIERELGRNPNAHLQVVYHDLPAALRFWRPEAGERLIRLHYILWQQSLVAVARRLHQAIGFDIVQHVSWGSLTAPTHLHKLGRPFVWGPIGGGQTAPPAFEEYFPADRWQERVRTATVRLNMLNPFLRATVRASDLVLVTNRETEQLVRQLGARHVEPMLDSGLPESSLPSVTDRPARLPKILWAGRLEGRKAPQLAIQAFARLKQLGVTARLEIAGSGPLRGPLEEMVASLGLTDVVSFRGQIPYAEMTQLFMESDVFLFTSMRDSFGSVVLEAMGHGLPVVTLDHQGVGTWLPAEASVKVPLTAPRDVEEQLARALQRYCQDHQLRAEHGRLARLAVAREHTWEAKVRRLLGLYADVLGGQPNEYRRD